MLSSFEDFVIVISIAMIVILLLYTFLFRTYWNDRVNMIHQKIILKSSNPSDIKKLKTNAFLREFIIGFLSFIIVILIMISIYQYGVTHGVWKLFGNMGSSLRLDIFFEYLRYVLMVLITTAVLSAIITLSIENDERDKDKLMKKKLGSDHISTYSYDADRMRNLIIKLTLFLSSLFGILILGAWLLFLY